MTAVDEKVDRVARCARGEGLQAIVLTRQPNFAWVTDGRSNRIDGSVEHGAGSVCVTAAGARYLIANAIEMPRLRDEALRDLGFQPLEYEWSRDHSDPAAPLNTLSAHLGGGRIGWDMHSPAAADVDRTITSLQTPLTDAEVTRYRALGREVARAVEQLCRSIRPGVSEQHVAQRVIARVAEVGARAIVTLVGADDRISKFRHPVPTEHAWTHTLLIGLCAERDGLVVALSRIVATRPSSALKERTAATVAVFRKLLEATRPGVSGRELFAASAEAYRSVGFAGEERRHHQGGAIGYRSRDWIAHPSSADIVQPRQAFAWNPSITGTKVEDTALLIDGTIELVTSTGEWPSIDVGGPHGRVQAAGILEM